MTQRDLFTPPAVQSTSAESLARSLPTLGAQHQRVWDALYLQTVKIWHPDFWSGDTRCDLTSYELAKTAQLDRMLCSRSLYYLERAGRVKVVTTRPCRITGRRAKAFVTVV